MTRTEFICAYAERSGLSDEWSGLGFIRVDEDHILIALPCGCDEELCQGWAMLPPDGVTHHLFFNAPEKLRDAYREAIGGQP